jgi:uncharacterized protein
MAKLLPSSHAHPWRFLLWAVFASWSVWAIGYVGGNALNHSAVIALQMGGSLAVGAIAVLMIYASRDEQLVHDFWCSIADPRRISVLGWAAAVLLMPALGCMAVLLDAYFAGGPSIRLGTLFQAGLKPLILVKTFGFGLIVGPFMEEIGWRGVALTPLQNRYGAAAGALILACVHALWHLPLFVLPDGYYHALGVLTPAFYWFMFDIIVFDMLAASLFNYSRASVLAAVLFHSSFNSVGVLWDLSPTAALYRDLFAAALAVLVVFGTRGKLFRRSD